MKISQAQTSWLRHSGSRTIGRRIANVLIMLLAVLGWYHILPCMHMCFVDGLPIPFGLCISQMHSTFSNISSTPSSSDFCICSHLWYSCIVVFALYYYVCSRSHEEEDSNELQQRGKRQQSLFVQCTPYIKCKMYQVAYLNNCTRRSID